MDDWAKRERKSFALYKRLIEIGKKEEATGAKMFLGKPDRWYEKPLWRCSNNHVSSFYLKSEERGSLCLESGCYQPLYLTFPEDKDGPL